MDATGLITVTHETSGVVRAVVACQGINIPGISTPRKEPRHDELLSRKGKLGLGASRGIQKCVF